MQGKKFIPSAGVGVSMEERQQVRELRLALQHGLLCVWKAYDLAAGVTSGRTDLLQLETALASLQIAAKDLRRTLEMVQSQEARWGPEAPTALIRPPVDRSGKT